MLTLFIELYENKNPYKVESENNVTVDIQATLKYYCL